MKSLSQALPLVILLAACGSDDNNKTVTEPPIDPPVTNLQYEFNSQLSGYDDQSSVSYTGQTARHMLIADLTQKIGGLKRGTTTPIEELEAFFTEQKNDELISAYGSAPFVEQTYGEISSGKDLQGKIAGGYPDPEGGEGSYTGETSRLLEGRFVGWQTDAVNKPYDLVMAFFARLAVEMESSTNLVIETDTTPDVIEVAYIDAAARDYKQLMQKFLLGAVTFSQGTADYLTIVFDAANEQDGSKAYTTAEHKWDEAFGYFGAARDMLNYTDDEIAAKGGRDAYKNGYFDSDENGSIDVRAELNLGNAVNCAKRDRGTVNLANPTDYTQQGFEAFYAGRKLLNDASSQSPNALTDDQKSELLGYAETAAQVWEKCIAATVVHYINDLTNDLTIDGVAKVQLASGDFVNIAKHYSEMKGFALGLQFSPYSPFQAEGAFSQFEQLHVLIGDQPVLPDAGAEQLTQYLSDLAQARNLLQEIYQFDPEHVANW